MPNKNSFLREVQYRYNTEGARAAAKWSVRSVFAKLAGVNECKAQIDTLHYFLNRYMDIREFPKATGALRQMQEADTALLRLFHAVCVKNHLTYWADGGTLLGAVRHGGFIPWDDDTDLLMPREDYNRAKTILKREFAPYGVVAEEDADEKMQRIGVGYKHEATGIWIDVLPVDECASKKPLSEIATSLCEKMFQYRKYYYKHRSHLSEEELTACKKKMISFDTSDSETDYTVMFHGPEFITRKWYMWDKAIIYPLQLMDFENIQLFVPHDCHAYLTMMFGNYMQFPKDGTEAHGEGELLAARASAYGIDMEEIKAELSRAYEDYTKNVKKDTAL